MKYSIPQERLDKMVFKYLNMQYGDLREVNVEHDEITFKKPTSDSEYDILGYDKISKSLHIYYKLADEISDMFSLEETDSENVIGRWVEDRYRIKINEIFIDYYTL